MQIPKRIKVGGATYEVHLCASDDNSKLSASLAGIFNPEKGYIAIRKGFNSFVEAVFLHEILHAVNSEIEEEKIEYLAQALYQVISDNPQVFKSSSGKAGGKSHNGN